MRISLAIATLGRTEELARLLDSLYVQTHTDFEVLIADQNPAGFLDAALAPYAGRLTIQRIAVAPRGVSAARNALLAHCTGQLVAFPDDDCWYVPDTLQRAADFFVHHPAVGSIIGVWSHDASAPELARAAAFPPAPLRTADLFVRGETYVQFYRRAVVDAVGGFDPQLGPGTGLPYGGGEDTDYMLRAAQHGPVWKVPTVRVLHPLQDMTGHPRKAKLHAYAQGRMYLLRKHNFPLWFKLANVGYPLWRAVKEGPRAWAYRWHMFVGRLLGLLRIG